MISLSIIGARVVYLQLFCSSWLSEAAAKQVEKSVVTQGKRGVIYDAKLREIAVSIDSISIAAYPSRFQDAAHAAKCLSRVLQLNENALLHQLTSCRGFLWVKRQAIPSEVEQVKQFHLKGISFIQEHSRFYPHKTLGAQLLGFTGVDGHGLEGIEYLFNQELKGDTHKLTVLTDALGREFEQPVPDDQQTGGNHIVLTVDRTIQYIVETALENGVKKAEAESGMAVVLSTSTGAVLAMANYPYFNPNAFGNYQRERWRNRTITDPFEPGSTMKIFTAAAALSSGLVDHDTLFYAENGAYTVGRNIIHDTRPFGWLSLDQIIKYSSNIGAVKVSEKVGPELLYNTLVRFGFGQKTGIDCPGETTGTLLPHYRWSKMDTSSIAFGQGVSVSAIQLAAATGAIANDGMLMQPYVVQAVMNQNGGLIKRAGPKPVRQVISPVYARAVRRMMASVIEDGGTGGNAAMQGYTACGKTGTAQKVGDGGYADGKYVASFVGFSPAEHPEIVVVVVIDEPKNGYHGGVVAAPVFKEIANKIMDYMNIPPQKNAGRMTVSYGGGRRG